MWSSRCACCVIPRLGKFQHEEPVQVIEALSPPFEGGAGRADNGCHATENSARPGVVIKCIDSNHPMLRRGQGSVSFFVRRSRPLLQKEGITPRLLGQAASKGPTRVVLDCRPSKTGVATLFAFVVFNELFPQGEARFAALDVVKLGIRENDFVGHGNSMQAGGGDMVRLRVWGFFGEHSGILYVPCT